MLVEELALCRRRMMMLRDMSLLAFLAALEKEVEIRERIVCCRDTYRLYSWALFNLHENCTSALISGCLKLITVHLSLTAT